MAGLVPAIRAFVSLVRSVLAPWMPGTSPGMTMVGCAGLDFSDRPFLAQFLDIASAHAEPFAKNL
jgi:hypothetical protein